MKLGAVVLDSNNSEELSDFYTKLLGWTKQVQVQEGEKWIVIYNESGKQTPLVFQEEPNYKRPVWPTAEGQQQMMHLDFYVDMSEYENKIKHAISSGAKMSEVQFSDNMKVMFDPAGHPFCIIPVPKEMMARYE